MITHSYGWFRVTMVVLVVFCAGVSPAQDLEFKKQTFHQKVDKSIATLSEEEAKETGVVLKEKTYIEYVIDKKDEKRYYGVYRRVHLNGSAAVEQYNKLVLPVASKDGLVEVKARSISRSGAVKEVGMEAVKDIEEEGRRYKLLAVEGVEVGGEVEFVYLTKGNISLFGVEVVQESVPLRESELHIVAPRHLIFEAKVYNGKNTRQDTSTVGGKRFLTLRSHQIPALLDEKYAAVKANRTRVEYKLAYNEQSGGKRILTWNDAGSRIYEFLHMGQENSEKALTRFLAKEKIKGLPEQQAIRTVENYVKTHVALRKDVEDDIAANVLERKFGTEAGLLRLYIGLFESLNIPFDVVIGCSRFEQSFDREFDTWNFLDKYLLYFPNSQKYLDPANPFLRFGLFDYSMEGTDAVYISTTSLGKLRTGLSSIDAIPYGPVDQNYDNIEANITFSPKVDQMNIQYVRRMGGYQAAQIRPYYFMGNTEERSQMLTGFLKQSLGEDIVMTNLVAKNANLNSAEVDKDFLVSADVSWKSILEKANQKVLVRVGELIGPQTEMYNEKPRQHPIDIGNVHSYTRILKIQVPEGYRLAGLDALKRNLNFSNGTLGFVSDYSLDKKVLTIRIEEFYKTVQLPISDYDNFQKVINAAADFNKVTLVLEKDSSPK